MTITHKGHSHKVVNHTPRQDWLLRSILVVIILSLISLAYYWGNQFATEENTQFEKQNTYLRERTDTIEAERQQYVQKTAILENTSKVDKLTIENMRILIRNLENDKESLKKKLAFYRGIIAPEDKTKGVKIHVFELVKGDKIRQFRLRIVVSQTSLEHSFLKGDASITIEGQQNNTNKSFSILELTHQKYSSLPLGFRYFQLLPDKQTFFDFTLPEWFTPKTVKVTINIRHGSVQKLNKTYEWEKELITDVEQKKTQDSP